MKKFLALMLAALMLFGMTAVAETADDGKTALVISLDNINLNVTNNGEQNAIALDDFSLMLAIDTANELEMTLAAYKGEEALAFAVAKFVENKMLLSFSNLDKTYEADIPQNGVTPAGDFNTLMRMLLPELAKAKPGMIDAVEIPKADLSGLFSMFSTDTTTENGATVTEFSIPSDVVDMLIDQISGVISAAAEQNPQVAVATQVIDSFKESGMKLSFAGNLTDTDDKQVCQIGVYVSTGEEAAEAPTLVLTTTSQKNSFAIELSSGDGSTTMATVSLASDPASNSWSFNIDIMGMITVALNTAQEAGTQNIDLDCNLMGTIYTSSTSYGSADDGSDFMNNTTVFGESKTVTTINSVNDGEGITSGTINVESEANEFALTFSADFYQELGTYESGYEMPADTAPISELTQEQMNEAIKPLIEYFTSLATPEAA